MELYLVRHGEAGRAAQDSARPLTPCGREEVGRVASALADRALGIQEIRHSGRARAEETAQIFADSLRPAPGIVAIDGLHPGDSVEPIAMSLAGETRALMLVGHLPFMGCLAGRLMTGDAERAPVSFTTGTTVCLRREVEDWELCWVLHPHEL